MDKPNIPDYQLEKCCGSGAYGDVWIAKDMNGIERAVKVLNKTRLKNLGVLDKEIRGLQLYRTKVSKHKNLVEIYHVGETDQHLYYVMDLADNISAKEGEYLPDSMVERLKVKKRFSIEESVYLVEKMLDAVEVLHKAGLAHRDIKPGNIIYINGTPKLTDIGLVAANATGITLAGTMGFIPPERVSGAETDLYALGKLLYCLYTGNSPDKFPSLAGALKDTPEAKQLNKFIIKACDKNSEKRFKTVDDFRNALEFGHHQSSKSKIFIGVALCLFLAGIIPFIFNNGEAPTNVSQLQKITLPNKPTERIKETFPSDDKVNTVQNKDIAKPKEMEKVPVEVPPIKKQSKPITKLKEEPSKQIQKPKQRIIKKPPPKPKPEKPVKINLTLTPEEIKTEEAKKFVKMLFFEELTPEWKESTNPSNMGYGILSFKKNLPENYEVSIKVKFKKYIRQPHNPTPPFKKLSFDMSILSPALYNTHTPRLGVLIYRLQIEDNKIVNFDYSQGRKENGRQMAEWNKITSLKKVNLKSEEWYTLRVVKTNQYIRFFINDIKVCGAKMMLDKSRLRLSFSYFDGFSPFFHFSDFKIYSLVEKHEKQPEKSESSSSIIDYIRF